MGNAALVSFSTCSDPEFDWAGRNLLESGSGRDTTALDTKAEIRYERDNWWEQFDNV